MFAKRLSKSDIVEYAENVVCSMNEVVAGNIEIEKIYDKFNFYKYTHISFIAYDVKRKVENKLQADIFDFQDFDYVHNNFMVDKFGFAYLDSFKFYVKSADSPEIKRDRMYAYKICQKHFYSKLNQDKYQTTLSDFETQK